MKKSKKITFGVIIGIIFLAVTGSLLGVFLPPLFRTSNIQDLQQNQVKPSEGNGNFLKYSTIADLPEDQKLQSIDQFALESLKTNTGIESYVGSTISNTLVDFFQNIKNSKSYTDRFAKWVEDTNKQWDDEVQSYKDKYGKDWEFYFQLNVLDPVGGNENDWKRVKYYSYVNSEFDSLVKRNNYINLVDANNNVVRDITERMLFDSTQIFNGTGNPNNIKFVPTIMPNPTSPSSFDAAFADLQSFIFDEYVKTEMPLVTSMVLFKHAEPAANNYSDFYNINKATNINLGSDPVGTSASYQWQAFKPTTFTEEGTWDTTAKYNNFIKDYNNPTTHIILGDSQTDATFKLGGAINIPVQYTDDSATLYFIKARDVYDTSFTQYAAAANFKLNNLLYGTTDASLPSVSGANPFKTGLWTNPADVIKNPGTEIMSNFMSVNTGTTGYFPLPDVVQSIINEDTQNTNFPAKYNGIKEITDTINIDGTPFIMTRNEAGVHIIGIDRYEAIQAATTYEQKITEIKNTLLWRYMISKSGFSDNTGFNLDLFQEINSFYDANRNEILIKYMISKQKTPPTTDAEKLSYIFSDIYSDMRYPADPNNKWLLLDSEIALFEAYYDYFDYNRYVSNNTTVKTKVLGLQTSYIGKTYGGINYGDALISNGIAGMLPYIRNTTANPAPNATNGVYDDVFGTYPSIEWKFSDGSSFSNITLQSKLDSFYNATSTFLRTFTGDLQLRPKLLTYSSAKFNQYLLVGNMVSTNTDFFASPGERINTSIGTFMSSSSILNTIINQKIKQQLKGDASPVIDFNTYRLKTNPNATLPTDNASAVGYINNKLQYAIDLRQLATMDSNTYYQLGSWSTLEEAMTLFNNQTLSNNLRGSNTQAQTVALRNFLTFLYAFDYDLDTNTYNFTRFRDYLLNATDNFARASFVWSTYDKPTRVQEYGDPGKLNVDFQFKSKIFDLAKNTYGYQYQNASSNAIKPAINNNTQLLFAPDVTFNNKSSYWNIAAPTFDANNQASAYTGFLGMQFQGNVSQDLDATAATKMFDANASYFVDANRTQVIEQGSLYSLGNDIATARSRLKTEIARIRNEFQKNATLNWLKNNYDIDITAAATITDISQAIIAIQNLSNSIPDIAFTRVSNKQLVNSDASIQQPIRQQYFGDVNNYASQVVVTQFNNDDVTELFDTNNDKVIDDNDKGINWTVVNTKGFLGVSAEAFFMSAYEWSLTNSLYANAAFNVMRNAQGKIDAYDRRLNDQLGEDWVENYKKTSN